MCMYNECIISVSFFFTRVLCFRLHEIVNGFGMRFVFVSNSIGLRTTSNNDSVVLFARYYGEAKNNVFQ